MHCLDLLIGLLLHFLCFPGAQSVIERDDIGIILKSRGKPIPVGTSIHLLSVAMLRLYRETVENQGDMKLPFWTVPWADEHASIVFEIRSFDRGRNMMSLGSSFYAIHFIIQSMLNPRTPTSGFRELEWQIINKAISPGYEIPLGYISLRLKDASDLNLEGLQSV